MGQPLSPVNTTWTSALLKMLDSTAYHSMYPGVIKSVCVGCWVVKYTLREWMLFHFEVHAASCCIFLQFEVLRLSFLYVISLCDSHFIVSYFPRMSVLPLTGWTYYRNSGQQISERDQISWQLLAGVTWNFVQTCIVPRCMKPTDFGHLLTFPPPPQRSVKYFNSPDKRPSWCGRCSPNSVQIGKHQVRVC